MVNLLLTTTTKAPAAEPMAIPAMQRFPESCQRSSLLDDNDYPEGESVRLPPTYSNFQRESSPSSRFYHRETHRHTSCLSRTSCEPPPAHNSSGPLSPLPQPASSPSSRFYSPSGGSRRRASPTPELGSTFELPSPSDCESTSDASCSSSDGPYSPAQAEWSGARTYAESPEPFERLPSPVDPRVASDKQPCPIPESSSRCSTPCHIRSSSEDSSGSLGSTQADLENHSTFSRVVVTKFSNPPRYRLKKVKFHECPICKKSFPRPSGLRTHMNMHTNTKPYACPHEGCDKSFSVISNAKRHYRTHLVELSPDQIGLPSGPYTVNFSEPVVLPDMMPPHEAFFASSSSQNLATSSSTSSLSSSQGDSGDHIDIPSRDRTSSDPDIFPTVEGRRSRRATKGFKWLPMGVDSRSVRERTTSL